MDEQLPDSKKNVATLYTIIHDYLKQNPAHTQDIVGVLETIKLEFVIDAIDSQALDEDIEEENEEN